MFDQILDNKVRPWKAFGLLCLLSLCMFKLITSVFPKAHVLLIGGWLHCHTFVGKPKRLMKHGKSFQSKAERDGLAIKHTLPKQKCVFHLG